MRCMMQMVGLQLCICQKQFCFPLTEHWLYIAVFLFSVHVLDMPTYMVCYLIHCLLSHDLGLASSKYRSSSSQFDPYVLTRLHDGCWATGWNRQSQLHHEQFALEFI